MIVEPDATVDPTDFRAVMGRWATGIAVVTASGGDGRPVGLTVNSFASVSLDPPLVLFSIDRNAGCFEVFQEAAGFAVNLLRDDQAELSSRFAGPDDERFASERVERWATGAPILCDALAALDCSVHARHDGGDHVIMVGRVRHLGVLRDGGALGYWRGGYWRLSELGDGPASTAVDGRGD